MTEARDSSLRDYEELELRYQQLERRANTTKEQITRQNEQSSNKKKQVRERMISLQETYSDLMNQRDSLQAESDLKMKEIRGLEDAIAELSKNNDKEAGIAEAAFNDLKDDVGELQRSLPILLSSASTITDQLRFAWLAVTYATK